MVRKRSEILSDLDEAIAAADGDRIGALSNELGAQPTAQVVERVARLRLEQEHLTEQLKAAEQVAAVERLRTMAARQAVLDAEREHALLKRESGAAENRAAVIRGRQRAVAAELDQLTGDLRQAAQRFSRRQAPTRLASHDGDRLTVREALILGVVVVAILAVVGGTQDLRLGAAILAGGAAVLLVLAWFGWYERSG